MKNKKQNLDNRITYFDPNKELLSKEAKKKYPYSRTSLNDLLRELTAVFLLQSK